MYCFFNKFFFKVEILGNLPIFCHAHLVAIQNFVNREILFDRSSKCPMLCLFFYLKGTIGAVKSAAHVMPCFMCQHSAFLCGGLAFAAMEAMLNFIPAPIAIALMLLGFVALAVGGIRLGYKATVKDLALELVKKAELSIMGSGQGAKKKKQVFAALRAKCPAVIQWAITDEVLDAVIERAFDAMTAALSTKKA